MHNVLEVVWVSIKSLGGSPAFLACSGFFLKEKDGLLILVTVAALVFVLSAEV